MCCFIAEFTTRHELKLYFDVDGRLLVAFTNIFLPKKRAMKGTDVEVLELRCDIPQQWLDHRVDEALAIAVSVRREIVRVAPSLAPLLRIDLIRTDQWGFLINEIEYRYLVATPTNIFDRVSCCCRAINFAIRASHSTS